MLIPVITAKDSPCLSKSDTGLGNVLFQIASVIGISHILHTTFGFPTLEEFGNILQERYQYNHKDTIFKKTLAYGHPLKKPISEHVVIHETENKYKHFDIFLLERLQQLYSTVGDDTNIIIQGNLESHLYFDSIADTIRELFSPEEETKQFFYKKYPILQDSSIIPVAVHCRYYDNTPIEYYKTAIQNMQEKAAAINKTCVFFMFSNIIHTFREQLQDVDPESTIWVTEEYDYLELWLMTLCQNFILGLSTFGWWGSFLSVRPEKMVFYPKHAIDYFGKSVHHLSPDEVMNRYFYPSYEYIG